MCSQLDAVEPHARFIVRAAELDEEPPVRRQRVIEVAAIPDRSFIQQQVRALRVPVAGHFEQGRTIEVVLHAIGGTRWLLIPEEAIRVGLHAVSEVAHLEWIDDCLPFAVERGRRSSQNVYNLERRRA